MNLDDLTIGEAKKLAAMFGGDAFITTAYRIERIREAMERVESDE